VTEVKNLPFVFEIVVKITLCHLGSAGDRGETRAVIAMPAKLDRRAFQNLELLLGEFVRQIHSFL
jgi:hypothetical protein